MRYFLIILTSCSLINTNLLAQRLSKQNLQQIYKEQSFTQLETAVFHSSAEFSTVYVNIALADFMYVLLPEGEGKTAKFSIDWVLYDSYEAKHIIDSSALIFTDTLGYEVPLEMIVSFEVKASFPGNYIMKIVLSDLNFPGKSELGIIEIEKSKMFSRQHYLITDPDDFVIFGEAIPPNRIFRLNLSDTTISILKVRYYNRTFPLAKPPFVTEKSITYDFVPDSVFEVNVADGKTALLQLPLQGIYHFQANPQSQEGVTLFYFDVGFPFIETPEQALAPLRYLSTEREFQKMLASRDYKPVIDSFWLQRSSQRPERAKNMIRRFYIRVEKANHYFTSYHEGWKTDRGLIYIIYGPPSEIYRKGDEEYWIYGEKGNPLSLRFTFTKAENVFTGNDYRLNRSAVFRTSWLTAIENWRR